MQIVRLLSASLVAVAFAAPAIVSASDNAQTKTAAKALGKTADTAPAPQLATLKDITAVPMSSNELKAVKGLHVHFVTISNGKLHLAGDVKTENNWSNEWGGTDGVAVAPSYKGLCKAHGNGSIFIPTMGPITTQCP